MSKPISVFEMRDALRKVIDAADNCNNPSGIAQGADLWTAEGYSSSGPPVLSFDVNAVRNPSMNTTRQRFRVTVEAIES